MTLSITYGYAVNASPGKRAKVSPVPTDICENKAYIYSILSYINDHHVEAYEVVDEKCLESECQSPLACQNTSIG